MNIIKIIFAHLNLARKRSLDHVLGGGVACIYLLTGIFIFFSLMGTLADKVPYGFNLLAMIFTALSVTTLLFFYFFKTDEGKEVGKTIGKHLWLAVRSSVNIGIWGVIVALVHITSVLLILISPAVIISKLTNDHRIIPEFHPALLLIIGSSLLFLFLGYFLNPPDKNGKWHQSLF